MVLGCRVGDGEKQRKILTYFIDTVLKVKEIKLYKEDINICF